MNKSKQQHNSNTKTQKAKSGGVVFKRRFVPTTKSYQSRVVGDKSSVMRIKKREYLTDVTPGVGMFKLTSKSNGLLTSVAELAGNLGLTKSFPWISQLAPAFENFIFHTLNFEYKPSCPTTTQGSITIVPQYDATRETSNDKTTVMSSVGTVRTPCYEPVTCKIDPKKMYAQVKSHKVRTGEPTSDADKKLTDPYKLNVYTESGANNGSTPLGELWVDYDVSLNVPKANLNDLRPATFDVNPLNSQVIALFDPAGHIKSSFSGEPYQTLYKRFGFVFAKPAAFYYLKVEYAVPTDLGSNWHDETTCDYTQVRSWGFTGTYGSYNSYTWVLQTPENLNDENVAEWFMYLPIALFEYNYALHISLVPMLASEFENVTSRTETKSKFKFPTKSSLIQEVKKQLMEELEKGKVLVPNVKSSGQTLKTPLEKGNQGQNGRGSSDGCLGSGF